MADITYPLAFFIGVFLETLLVGVFIPLVIVAIYVQWNKASKGRSLNRVMVFTTVFFGLIIPIRWILSLRRAILATLYLPPGVTVEQFLSPPYVANEIARRAIFQFSIVVGDLVMIYRMYHIYDRSILACVIPSITTAGLTAIACGLTNSLRSLQTPSEQTVNDHWVASCLCVTLFNSTFMSTAICYRLWKVHRDVTAPGLNLKSFTLTLRAMRVLVESAALWTFLVIMNFIHFLVDNNLRFAFLDMTSPAVGISFCLIIVRLGTITPEIRERVWDSGERTRPSRLQTDSRVSRLSVQLDRVKVERDVYVSDAESGIHIHMNPISTIEKPSPVD